jgi:tetratricopeptide (TPR) repeat protein
MKSGDSVFELKAIAKQSIPKALERAERYRLLNEPREAQSICLDVLEIDPDNRAALQTLLLALTDQFPSGPGRLMDQARQLLPRLGAYEQKYYAGIILESFARHQLDVGHPGANSSAYVYLCEAMAFYDQAHELAPEDNDEAILRHNTCVRTIAWHHLVAPHHDEQELPLE